MISPSLERKLQSARQALQSGNHEEGLAQYDKLVRQFPQTGILMEYAGAANNLGDYDLADQIWEKVRAADPRNAILLSKLAWKYQGAGLHSKAHELYKQITEMEPANLDLRLKQASYLSRVSSVAETRESVNKCLEIDPRNELARFLSAQMDRRDNKFEEAEKQFREMLPSCVRHPHLGYSCHYELAHILDRTDRFAEAWTHVEEGQKLARQTARNDEDIKKFEAWNDKMARRIKSLPKDILGTWGKSYPSEARLAAPQLAYLSGSARSGTTLLEKVLDTHPSIAACDESLICAAIISPLDSGAMTIAPARLNDARGRYMKSFAKLLGAPVEGKVLLDKNPSRTAFLPALLRVFPELRVLIALRDPRDVLVSLFFQTQSSTSYETIERLARYYATVMDIWLAVRDWEGFAWMETRYESTVEDLQTECGRVTRFLGLEWHDNQARFYEGSSPKTSVTTNYIDVTQPVFKKSVGRWQVYEKQLAPVLPLLETYCKKFGYE